MTTISRTDSFPRDPFTDEESKRIEDALRTALAAMTAKCDEARAEVERLTRERDGLRAEVGHLRLTARTPPPTIPMGRPVFRIDDAIMVASPDFIPRADHEREVREACIACVEADIVTAGGVAERAGIERLVDRVLAERKGGG